MNMNKFVVNKNSWHFKMQDKMGTIPQIRRDFCSYWRGAILSLFLVAVITVTILFSLFLCFIVGDGLFGEYFSDSIVGYILSFLSGFTFMASIIGFAILIATMPSYIPKKISNKVREATQKEEPSIFVVKYKSWKEKYCPMVEFVDNE